MPILGKDPALPNYARPEYYETAADLKLIQDELGGTRAMHAASESYITKWEAEAVPNYDKRRRCETFFEAFGRTLSAAVGMLFARPPQVVWNRSEAAFAEHWANIDAGGTAGPVFLKRFGEAGIKTGLSIILVDHPPAPEGVTVTAENEARLNLRPTWAMYERGAAINWRTARVDNAQTLTLLVLYEPATVDDGVYGVATKHRYRVLRLQTARGALEMMGEPMSDAVVAAYGDAMPVWATWEVWELKAEQDGTKAEDFLRLTRGVFRNRAGEVANRLPVAVAQTGRVDGLMRSSIPLMGVAWANLAHWQLSSELRFNTSVAAFAQPVVIGKLTSTEYTAAGLPQAPQLRIGPLVSVNLEAGGDYKWVEPAGTGLERLAKLVVGKLEEIAALGVSFLQRDKRAAETAEAKAMDAAAENSTLATAGQGIEDAANLALEIHAWYLGIGKADAPVLTLNRDYENVAMDAAIMTAYVNAVKDAGLPVRAMLEAWQQGGRIPADADLDTLEMEAMAAQQAAADRQAEEDELAQRREVPA